MIKIMIRFFENIFYIFEGFFNWVFSFFNGMNSEAKKRYSICKECSHKKGAHCGICGCFLKPKILVKYPLDKDGISIGGCPDFPPRW